MHIHDLSSESLSNYIWYYSSPSPNIILDYFMKLSTLSSLNPLIQLNGCTHLSLVLFTSIIMKLF